MKFELIKDLTGMKRYGDIPDTFDACEECVERYWLEESDWLVLEKNIDEINTICGSLLDYGDVDYFDASRCIMLQEWIICQLNGEIPERARELYSILLEYTKKAISFSTGVVIEL